MYDQKGIEYLDFYGAHAVISIGHAHPHYVQRITKQLQRIGFYSNSVINSLKKELGDKLGKLSNCEDYQLFLINSGAEANENAIKLSSFQNGRKKVLAFKKSFHGRTSAACNTTDDPKIKAEINKTFDVTFCELNDTEAVEKAWNTEEYACAIIEGIQGKGGIYLPGTAFLTALQEVCKKTNTVLILGSFRDKHPSVAIGLIVESFAERTLKIAELDDHNGPVCRSNAWESVCWNIITGELGRLGDSGRLNDGLIIRRNLGLRRCTSPNDIPGQDSNRESQNHKYRIKVGTLESDCVFRICNSFHELPVLIIRISVLYVRSDSRDRQALAEAHMGI